MTSIDDENQTTPSPLHETKVSKQTVVLSRKPLTSQENKTHGTKLAFTTTSIDNRLVLNYLIYFLDQIKDKKVQFGVAV